MQLQHNMEGGPAVVVFDPAGHATTKTIETFRSDAPQIMWEQAEKSRKVEFIQLLNDDLRSNPARTTVETDSPMVKESRRLRWKRVGKVAEDADHSDLGDAWLYAWRKARDMVRELPSEAKDPTVETPYDRFMRQKKEQANNASMVGVFASRRRDIEGRFRS